MQLHFHIKVTVFFSQVLLLYLIIIAFRKFNESWFQTNVQGSDSEESLLSLHCQRSRPLQFVKNAFSTITQGWIQLWVC